MEEDIQLSKNLSLAEVIKSNTAIREGIDNTPTREHLYYLIQVAESLFQPIREHFGVPVYISSGYRSYALNEAVKGADGSYHTLGMALDLDQDFRGTNVSNADIFYFIRDNLQFTELIWEYGDSDNPAWVHVAYDPNNLKREVIKL